MTDENNKFEQEKYNIKGKIYSSNDELKRINTTNIAEFEQTPHYDGLKKECEDFYELNRSKNKNK